MESISWIEAPKLLERLKCESKSENNSLGTFPNLKHFKGKKGVLELWNED